MDNLDQLKNSNTLLQGFDSFLNQWFACESTAEKTDWDQAAMKTFKALPPAVFEFHSVVDRWPQSKIVIDNNQYHLERPPTVRTAWYCSTRKAEIPDPPNFSLVTENQGNWIVWASKCPQLT